MYKLITDKKNQHTSSTSTNRSRCIEQRVGSQLTHTLNSRILAKKGDGIFNKRKRATDDTKCFGTPCTKMRRLSNKDLHRQHSSLEICFEGRRNKFIETTRDSNKDPRDKQQIPTISNISVHSKGAEHHSQQTKPTTETTIRVSTPTAPLQQDQQTMGAIQD
ncbi:hypothetical protein K501DRAFT_271111 [Backusella circina FSU 941]|nr:hypothetical protein K501DRAFT_271111 [Backusella circina FSU 941]